MDDLEEEINLKKIEDFKIPDVDPVKRKYFLISLIIIFAISQIIYIFLVIFYMLQIKDEIFCKFYIHNKNEKIKIINKEAYNDLDFDLIIDGISVTKNFEYTFEKPGSHEVTFKLKKKISSMGYLFYGVSKMTEIDLSKIYNEDFKNITGLFMDCDSLEKINFGKFKKKITYMEEAFYGCYSLKELDLSSFNTENVKNMKGIFFGCNNLAKIKLSNLNTNNVEDISEMFNGCHSLKDIDLTNFNTSKVTNMESMFSGCKSLKKINLSNFNFKKVEYMSYMFSDCESLIDINFGISNTDSLKEMSGIFMDCFSLEKIDLTNFKTINVEDMSLLFYNCLKLEKLESSTNFNTSICLLAIKSIHVANSPLV